MALETILVRSLVTKRVPSHSKVSHGKFCGKTSWDLVWTKCFGFLSKFPENLIGIKLHVLQIYMFLQINLEVL